MSPSAAEPPIIPIGLDAYRQWDRWPYQRIGVRSYLRSTYDRSGGNEGADASHFLYQLSDTNNVTLDVSGAGILYFARYNHWHGSPWHYLVDGVDHIVQETSTAAPMRPREDSTFLPAGILPPPLAFTWARTKGADLSWVPIAFEHSFRMDYSRTHYGTGYYIYHQYADGSRLSRPIRAWDGRTAPDTDVLKLLERSGTDLCPTNGVRRIEGTIARLEPLHKATVCNIRNGPATLRKLSFSVPVETAIEFGRTRLLLTWDKRLEPSVDAPTALFFGAGTLYNRDSREFLVRAFPVSVRYGSGMVELSCFFPMPFFGNARVELVGTPAGVVSNINWSVGYQPLADPPGQVGYLHASYRDHTNAVTGRDLVLLDTKGTEGAADWSGSFIGTSFIFSDRAELSTLEGDPRFFFDDSQTPQGQGTGTEEWGGGGDYWGGRNMTLPFAGHPVGAPGPREAKSEFDKIESGYRFLLADLMPFGKNAVICLEHGGRDESAEHYQTVTYWYGAPAPSLVKTDQLQVGNPRSETAHAYYSPAASEPYEIRSRYELGAGPLSEQVDIGRKTAGTSEFTLKLNPKNLGVLLRRKLDYAFPNQRAEVFVGEAEAWRSAGVWYLAGGSTCVYSNPKEELGATQHIVQTSDRRFRDDEFLLARKFTEGKSAVRVRVQFIPVTSPLYPGYRLPELAWSEIRYDAYCYTLPVWDPRTH